MRHVSPTSRFLAFTVGALGAVAVATPRAHSAETAPATERFSFVALGCMPYGEANYPAFERLLSEINRRAPAFTVHCGDLHSGSEKPTDAFHTRMRAWFDQLDHAVMYTPGDNEWTDVHKTHSNPAEWLAKIREGYFREERSLGRRPIPLTTQRRMPGFEKFVENARWSRGGVVFATVHVVGSGNNFPPVVPGAQEEFRERDRANEAWLRGVFAEAKRTQAKAIALFFQAQPNFGPGFTTFLATIESEARAFAKPVLLVHADGHRYLNERTFAFTAKGTPLPNVSRVETFGAGDIHAVQVVVDPDSRNVFLAGPLIVPGNALPVLSK